MIGITEIKDDRKNQGDQQVKPPDFPTVFHQKGNDQQANPQDEPAESQGHDHIYVIEIVGQRQMQRNGDHIAANKSRSDFSETLAGAA